MADTPQLNVVGTSPVRHDGVDKVTGRAIFGVDVTLPGMLHARVLRSPHAHARITHIDTSAADRLPGVAATVVGTDVPIEPLDGPAAFANPIRLKALNAMAQGTVLYHGHAVAAVAAVSPHVADEALRHIRVEYEVLTPVVDIPAALAPDAPILHPDLRMETAGSFADAPSNVAKHLVLEEGDITSGFELADVVVERTFSTSTVHQGYIEPHNACAFWRSDGTLELHCSSQGHFGIRNEVSQILGIPISTIRVVPAEIGGGFGGKLTNYVAIPAVLLAQKSGRPVKMSMDRTETLLATGPAPAALIHARLGATKDGRLTAAHLEMHYEAGAFPGSSVGGGANCGLAPYRLENFRVDGYDVLVNKPKSQAYRAPGAPQAAFAVESVMDELSDDLGLDPVEFRLRNASAEGDIRPNGTRFNHVGNIDQMRAAQSSQHWQAPLSKSAGRLVGRGVACGYWGNGGGTSSAVARLNRDGSVTLLESSPDIGGTRTSIAMQLAETLGIDVSQVHPRVPDTDSIAEGGNTAGSRTTFATGWAAIDAGRNLQQHMCRALADVWELEPEVVQVTAAGFTANGHVADFGKAAQLIIGEGEAPVGSSVSSPSLPGNAFATHIVDVGVDPETGKVDVLRYTAVHDVGRAVYPPYAEGQIEGGVAQGIGWALTEAYAYDSEGHLVNASLLDYRMPTTLDVPVLETIMVEVPNPGHPYGVRGVGELPIVPPLAALANAIHDATGVRVTELPASPARVLAALNASGASHSLSQKGT